MKYVFIKLFIGLVLFGTLVALTVLDVPNSARLVDLCYAGLVGLGIMHLGGPQEGDGGASPDKQGGFASLGLMACAAIAGLSMAACSSVTTQTAQVTYTQACAAYGGAFNVMIALRKAGKLNPSQIDQVSTIDSQITPMCTGPLPQDLDTATQKVTAAVTALAILEAAK
jgi:hypothetical protein